MKNILKIYHRLTHYDLITLISTTTTLALTSVITERCKQNTFKQTKEDMCYVAKYMGI